MNIPQRSAEQRRQSGQRAVAARRARASVKVALRAGSLSVTDVMEKAQSDDAVGRMAVRDMIEAVPGIGAIKAERIMVDIGIASSRRLRGLGKRQTQELVERLS